MARNLKDDEERERRIVLVGEHIAKTGDSTRKTAQYFSRTYFPISNCTVSDYCHRYIQMRGDQVDMLRERIYENTSDKVMIDPEVRKRILQNVQFFQEGATLQAIADSTGIDFWVIYRDFHHRLPKINEELYEEVLEQLKENSKNNSPFKKKK